MVQKHLRNNVENFSRANKITFNFKGVGIENDGEVPFWAKLNKVSSKLNFSGYGNDYSSSTKYVGQTKESVSANGVNETITIRPEVEGEVGFNLKAWGVAKPSVAIVENFNIGFDIKNYNTSYSTTTNTTGTKTTKTVDYEQTAGSKLDWTNTLTPKFGLDFDLDEKLTLKTEVSAAVGVTMTNTEVDTYKTTTTTKKLNKETGLYETNSVVTSEGAVNNSDGKKQNTNYFRTSVNPEFKLGLVYKVIPGKTNINFGVDVAPGAYLWEVTDTTNANINTIQTTKTTDSQGNTTTSKAVTIASNDTEKRFSETWCGDTTATFNIGATWFFTENAKLDVWYQNDFTSLFSDSNEFGVDFSVMF